MMRAAGPGASGDRMRALVVVLWRAGLRIGEALAGQADQEQQRRLRLAAWVQPWMVRYGQTIAVVDHPRQSREVAWAEQSPGDGSSPREIKPGTVRAICEQLEIPLPGSIT